MINGYFRLGYIVIKASNLKVRMKQGWSYGYTQVAIIGSGPAGLLLGQLKLVSIILLLSNVVLNMWHSCRNFRASFGRLTETSRQNLKEKGLPHSGIEILTNYTELIWLHSRVVNKWPYNRGHQRFNDCAWSRAAHFEAQNVQVKDFYTAPKVEFKVKLFKFSVTLLLVVMASLPCQRTRRQN